MTAKQQDTYIPINLHTGSIPTPTNLTDSIAIRITTDTSGVSTVGVLEMVFGIPVYQDGISNYQIDYLITCMEEIITRELNKNSNVVSDPAFQKFLQWALEFKRIVLESRANPPTYTARLPFQTGINASKLYACDMAGPNGHQFTPAVTTALRNAIDRNINPMDPKIYYGKTALQGFGLPSEYISLCGRDGMLHNLPGDVIVGMFDALEDYMTKPTVPQAPISDALEKFHTEIEEEMARTNDQIINGDYRIHYSTIEKKLRDTIGFLDDLTAATDTEVNVIQHTADAENFYENIEFTEADVDPALVIPTDTVDMVERDQIYQKLVSTASKYTKMATASMVASAHGLSFGTGNVNVQPSYLLKRMAGIANIINPAQDLLDLAMSRIYKNNKGDKVVEYLDTTKQADLTNRQIAEQKNYLQRITTDVPITEDGHIGESREEKYKAAYQPVTIAQRGGNKSRVKNNYRFTEKSTQNIPWVQTGGAIMDMDKLTEQSKNAKIKIIDLQTQIQLINNIYAKQNRIYFENENFVNLENLQQKNDFLIEMMNIIILYNFMLSDNTAEHLLFFNEMKAKILNFKSDLTNIWNVMQAKLDTGVQDEDVLRKLRATAMVTTSEIQTLLTSIGLKPSMGYVPSDEMINRATNLKLLTALADKYNVENISLIANELRNVLALKPVTNIDKSKSIDDLYTGLYTYYTNLKSLNSSLVTQYNNIDATILNMERIKQFAGDVIGSNLTTANTFITELITVLQNFGLRANILQNIKKEIRNSKNRFTEFETYTKEAGYKLKSKDVIGAQHDTIIKPPHAIVNHDMATVSNIYKDYVTDYINKLAGASSNVIPYYSYEKNLRYVKYREDILGKNRIELSMVSTGIFGNWKNIFDRNKPFPTSKLTDMIKNPTTIDVTANFAILVAYIKTFINNFIGYKINDGSLIPLFPNIIRRINIPSHVDNIISSFSAPKPREIKYVIGTYLTFDQGNLKSVPGMKTSDQYDLANHLADILKKYVLYIRKYRNDPNNLHTDDMDNYLVINKQITTYQDTFIQTKKDTDLLALLDYIKKTNTLNINDSSITNDITSYLQLIQDQSKSTREQIRDMIVPEFNTMASSIYDLFNEKIQERYQLINGLALASNSKNPVFAAIQKAQRDAAKLSISAQEIHLAPVYESRNKISDRLKPTTAGPNPNPNLFVKNNFDTIISEPQNLHTLMNTFNAGNQKPFLLFEAEPRNRTFFNNVRDDFREFYRMADPLLRLMKRMIENGKKIQQPAVFDIDYNIIRNEWKYYMNAFTYTTQPLPNIITTHAPLRLYLLRADWTAVQMRQYDPFRPSPQAYIPVYNADKLTIIGGAITYTINMPTAYDYTIYLENRPIKLSIATNTNITPANIDYAIKILNTGRYIVDFMDRLYNVVETIKTLNVEVIGTWDKVVNVGDLAYDNRRQKKSNLLNVLYVLEGIDKTIRENNGNYFYLDTLLLGAPNAIFNARSIVESIDPSVADFNSNIDKIWIFARKLVSSWYIILAHMLTAFILNESVNDLLELIDRMDINTGPLLSLAGMEDTIRNTRRYDPDINQELNSVKTQLEKNRREYPIRVDYDVPPDDKFFIEPGTKDIVVFDHFFHNIGTKSEKIYVMMALIKKKKLDEIRKHLDEVVFESNRVVNFIDQVNPYLDGTYINNKIRSVTVANHTRDELITQMNNFSTALLAEYKILFESIGHGGPWFELYFNSRVDIVMNKVINGIAPVPIPVGTDPATVPNIIINPANPVTVDIIKNSIDVKYYQFLYNQFIMAHVPETTYNFFRLFLTDIYRIVFRRLKKFLDGYMNHINSALVESKVKDFQNFREAFRIYFENTKFIELYEVPKLPYMEISDSMADDANAADIKFVLFDGQTYADPVQKKLIDDIFDVLQNVTSYVKADAIVLYESETKNYEELAGMVIEINVDINKIKNEIHERNQKLKNIIDTITQVMFDENYKRFAFVDNTELLEYLSQVNNNYITIWQMIEQKIFGITAANNYHTLTLSQINGYQTFIVSLTKLFNGEPVTNKFYKRMSFGLIEYYFDILSTILNCLEAKSFDDMSDVESYLNKYHYIQIKRCYKLFWWLRYEYFRKKQSQDDDKRKNKTPYVPILKHKIELLKTRRQVNLIFGEFQGLRKYLDDYSAVMMDKVQLHLRINDFLIKEYNEELIKDARDKGFPEAAVEFMLDTDPNKDESYQKRWESNNLIFTNFRDDRKLEVSFKLMEQIYKFDHPVEPLKKFEVYYKDVYDKMIPKFVGVDFDRIYNTLIYPDSDIISNYMSIAPNIVNGKGTVIMTYGYSGTGKSASLFGRPADPAKGILSPSNGILQATMDQFSKVEIYFRVFEIYGLGTQYNYYWNPLTSDGTLECFPNFTQSVIHHVIDTSDPTKLVSSDRIVFTNRHDILSYIMNLQNPKTASVTINATDNSNRFNLGGKRGYATYFQGNRMANSTYVEIKEAQYRNFTLFTDGSLEPARRQGITIRNVLQHTVQQVKGTINNKDSSRSILVYDFEINLNPTSATPIFVPFLIYDLPGKEDIYRTYVETDLDPAMKPDRKARVFDKVGGDIAKERKSTYVTNPLLIPIFDNNADTIRDIMMSLSSDTTTPTPGYNTAGSEVKFWLDYENELVDKIKDHNIVTFSYPEAEFTDDSAHYTIGDFFTTPTDIDTFVKLFDQNNLRKDFVEDIGGTTPFEILIMRSGIIGTDIYLRDERQLPFTPENIAKEIWVLICIVLIAYLIKDQLFDVVVEIINVIMNGERGENDGSNGKWSRSKIYAFFEAYYINENVVGLLQYLINRILIGKQSSIAEQETINEKMGDTVNKNYKAACRYRALLNLQNDDPDKIVGNNYELIVNPDLLNTGENPLRDIEIAEFAKQNELEEGGVFADYDTKRKTAFDHMSNVISFENKGKYDSNKLFRSGDIEHSCDEVIDPDRKYIINPRKAVMPREKELIIETNRPLLQDFIEPYEQKISFYYIFYVVSNSQMRLKAEEQIKLLNNSMPFIKEIDPTLKKNKCG
jgi:hypothetical protein